VLIVSLEPALYWLLNQSRDCYQRLLWSSDKVANICKNEYPA
jgi:hypothetical protein